MLGEDRTPALVRHADEIENVMRMASMSLLVFERENVGVALCLRNFITFSSRTSFAQFFQASMWPREFVGGFSRESRFQVVFVSPAMIHNVPAVSKRCTTAAKS